MTTNAELGIQNGIAEDDSSVDRRMAEANASAQWTIASFLDPTGYAPNYVQRGALGDLVAADAEYHEATIAPHRRDGLVADMQEWLKEAAVDRDKYSGTSLDRVFISTEKQPWFDFDTPQIVFATLPDDATGQAIGTMLNCEAIAIFFSPRTANPRVRVMSQPTLRVNATEEDLVFDLVRTPKNSKRLDAMLGSIVCISDEKSEDNNSRADHRYLVTEFTTGDEGQTQMHVEPWIPSWYKDPETALQDRLAYPGDYGDGEPVYPTEMRPNDFAPANYWGIVGTYGSIDEAVEAAKDLRQAVRTFDQSLLDTAYEPEVWEVADAADALPSGPFDGF